MNFIHYSSDRSPVVIGKPDNIILFQIFPELYFNDFKRDNPGIFQPVLHTAFHERALSLAQQPFFPIEFNLGSPAHHDPVLAPVVMELQRQVLSRF